MALGATRALARVALVALFLTGSPSGEVTEARGAAPPTLHGTIIWPPGTARARPLSLLDQNHRRVTLASLRGRVLLVTFMDSRCWRACPSPVIGREVAIAQWALGPRSPLTVIVVSVAPGLDTPASVRAFVGKVQLSGPWHWLLGTRAQLAPVWARWGIYVRRTGRTIRHSAALYLIDQQGYVRVAYQMPLRPDQLAESVRALVRDRRP